MDIFNYANLQCALKLAKNDICEQIPMTEWLSIGKEISGARREIFAAGALGDLNKYMEQTIRLDTAIGNMIKYYSDLCGKLRSTVPYSGN